MNLEDAGENESTGSIIELKPSDVEHLRLGWWSRTDANEMRHILGAAPGASVWIPDAQDFLLVGPWRHRHEILHMVELASVRRRVELTQAAVQRARAAGARLFLSIEMSERQPDSFYVRAGLSPVETVQSYELIAPRNSAPIIGKGEIRLVEELSSTVLEELTTVDWGAFPWVWRNSPDEFRDYFGQTGVEIYMLRDNGVAIGYLGITVFPGWGHIDRLAIVESKQGMGFGRSLTEFAINRLIALGAVRVGLSTQERNSRSQALYARLGFRRQVAGDYRIFGCALDKSDSIDDLVMGTGK